MWDEVAMGADANISVEARVRTSQFCSSQPSRAVLLMLKCHGSD